MAYRPEQIRVFSESVASGASIIVAAKLAGMSEAGARKWLSNNSCGEELRAANRQARMMPPRKGSPGLNEQAQKALGDFAYFQRRYFGRIAVPWQAEAAEKVVGLLASNEEEYAVINAPPGSGKSTTFTLDIPAWITCRNRKIRGLIGSATGTQASWYTNRLRRAFERTTPEKGEGEMVAKGLALDAVATLSQDFGRFRPVDQDVWTAKSFVVMQPDGSQISEKEPTWSAFGKDQKFLGGRYDIVIWDDLVDPARLKNSENVDADRDWWSEYAETRLEPGGLLVLQGQRMGPNDLYRYALDQLAYPDEEDEDDGGERDRSELPRKYHHIKFKAHYDDICGGPEMHKRTSPPYGKGGCLLYPQRLPGRKLFGIRENRREKFEVVYQQEDVDPANVLVNPLWVSGGTAPNGVMHPGCWDKDRDRLEIPKGLAGDLFSVVSCDPSPTRFWSIQWWIYNHASEQRFLIDLERRGLDANDFLDRDYQTGEFTGLMAEWQKTSIDLGAPISHWIVEINAAQRFLLQYQHTRDFMTRYRTNVVAHSTHRNKSDPNYGVSTIAEHWKYGRVRLPGKNGSMGRTVALKLVEEVTRYPQSGTDDCVMAQWFLEWQLPNIYSPSLPEAESVQWRPSWMPGGARELVPA